MSTAKMTLLVCTAASLSAGDADDEMSQRFFVLRELVRLLTIPRTGIRKLYISGRHFTRIDG